MGENTSIAKIKHLEKFMQEIPLNVFFKDTECRYIYANELCDWLNKKGDDWTIVGKTDLEAWKKVGTPIYPLSFISCDCNCLKHINDTYGHEYGDQLLCFVGELFRTYLPKKCFVFTLK